MKKYFLIIILLFSSTLVTSQSWALPNCPSSGYFHNCFGYDNNGEQEYHGEWQNDMPNGHGTVIKKDGQKYRGNFKNGLFHGFGRYFTVEGNIYEGDFVNGIKHGFGVTTFANGVIYKGEYQNNLYNGKGEITTKSGDVYKGEFKNGKIEGYGSFKRVSGEIVEGLWKDGKLVKAKEQDPNTLNETKEVLAAPGPVPIISGKTPKIVERLVISIGLNLIVAASTTAVSMFFPSL